MKQRDIIEDRHTLVFKAIGYDERNELIKLLDTVPHAAIAIENGLRKDEINPDWYTTCLYGAIVNYKQPFVDPEAARVLKAQISGVGNNYWSNGLSPLEKASRRLIPRWSFLFLEAIACWREGIVNLGYPTGGRGCKTETIFLLPEGFRVVDWYHDELVDRDKAVFLAPVLREPTFQAHPYEQD